MKLELIWSNFAQQVDSFIEEGIQLHLTEKEVLTEQDFNNKKDAIDEWNERCLTYLKQSFIEDENGIVLSFRTAGKTPFRILGQQKSWSQLKVEIFIDLKMKIDALISLKKILSVSDVIVNPELIEVSKRNDYSIEQKLDLILFKLYDLFDMNHYSIPMILDGNGIELKLKHEDREFGKLLEDAGLVSTLHNPETCARLTIQGRMYVEGKRKEYYEDYSDLNKSPEEINSKIDEILVRLEKLGYGQEIIFDEIQELKELYLTLNKKHWGQIVKGKLIDLILAKLIENDTISYIYKHLTNHTLRLP